MEGTRTALICIGLSALLVGAAQRPVIGSREGHVHEESTAAIVDRLAAGRYPPIVDDRCMAVAAQWMARFAPADSGVMLGASPALIPGVLGTLAAALAQATEPVQVEATQAYLAATARARASRLQAVGPGWSNADIDVLGSLVLVSPRRFTRESVFRQRVLAAAPQALGPDAGRELRARLLQRIAAVPGIEFDHLEAFALGWGMVERASMPRREAWAAPPRVEPVADESRIDASIYSLPSAEISEPAALELLRGVHRASPARTLVVIADQARLARLQPFVAELGLVLVNNFGLPYSPWPRDPLTFRTGADGRLVVLVRPNTQPGREVDGLMARTLIQSLPAALDEAWGRVRWSSASVPFHNGHVLLSQGSAWISVHSVEPLILEHLGLGRVPVENFNSPLGGRYVAAAEAAAAELESVYGRSVRFVHPLPRTDNTAAGLQAQGAVMATLGGGAGFDLDSLVTLLSDGEQTTAVVADLDAGARLLAAVDTHTLDLFALGYGLAPRGARLANLLATAQRSPRARALDAYLEVTAVALAEHAHVVRLPLLLVPYAFLIDPGAIDGQDFLVGWNNVVLEKRDGALRAEGFASLLPEGDALARDVFSAAGYELDLLPPLVESVVRNGGYRCASQHVRLRRSVLPGLDP